MQIRNKFNDLSLKYKFLVVFFVFITLPTLLIGILIYLQANQVLKEQANESTLSILDKIEGNLSGVIHTTENISAYAINNNDFRTFMSASDKDFNKPFYRQTIENIKSYITFQLLSNEYISSISVRGENGNFLNFGESLKGNESTYDSLALEKQGGTVWSDIYTLHSGLDNEAAEVLSLSRVINDYNNINKQLGFIRIRLNSDKLGNIIEIPNLQEEASIFLTDMNKDIIMDVQTSDSINGEETILSHFDNKSTAENYWMEADNYLIVNRKVDSVDWNLTAIVNQNQIAERLVHMQNSIRNMIIILTVFGLIAVIGYYYADVRRIIKLTEITEQMEKKDFSVHVKDDSRDEIGRLGYRFNKMIETIRHHINIEYKLKLSQKESEMRVLQNQIDPHFLYNTLDMIRWKARMENANETSYLIELLSKMFRNSLRIDKLSIKIKDELLFVKSYLDLQKKRINGDLQFTLLVDHQLENYLILKQTIQPLVENTIKHGFYGKRDLKIIQVRCFVMEETLVIDVMDNGNGMEYENFKFNIQNNEGHALKNLQDRITFAFGLEYGLDLGKNESVTGTWIRIKLPIVKSEANFKKSMGDIQHDQDDFS